MVELYYKYKKQIDKVAFLLFFFVIIYIFINHIFYYVFPFAIAYVLSLILDPVVKLANKYIKIPRSIASLLTMALAMFGLYILGNSIFIKLFEEGKAFVEDFPSFVKDLEFLIDFISNKISELFTIAPVAFHETINKVSTNLITSLTSSLGTIFKDGSISFVSKVPNVFMNFILTLVSLFFILKDKELINNSIKKITPDWLKKRMEMVQVGVLGALSGYLKAQGIIMSLIFIICTIALSILKFEYAFIASIAIAIVDALPIFGSGFILWPWAALNLIEGDYSMAAGLLVTYAVIQVSRQVLEPRILGKQIGIHPLITLMSIYSGLKIFGPFGFIIGPFIVITAKAILQSTDSYAKMEVVQIDEKANTDDNLENENTNQEDKSKDLENEAKEQNDIK